jgi:hypothetical protein
MLERGGMGKKEEALAAVVVAVGATATAVAGVSDDAATAASRA